MTRGLAVGDVKAIREVLVEAPEAAHWSAEELRRSVADGSVNGFVSEEGESVSGFVIGRQIGDEAEILNLAVRKALRRDGIASQLVGIILKAWRECGVNRVFLEVRESNAGAIAFYEKLGFQRVGKRKDYYDGPRENALVMNMILRKSTS